MTGDPLNIKINDYCNYVNLAVKNFREQNYSDSALNARKAAEAACKIIIYHAFNLKVAENKIYDKSLRELIIQLIRDGKTKKEAINHIETLQLIGNRAAHDNVIIKDEAAHCLNGLNLLTDYLFNENLKISRPSALNFDVETKKETEIKNPEIVEKIIIQEKIVQQKIDEETKEALFNEIKDFTKSERTQYEALFEKRQNEFHQDKEKQNREKLLHEQLIRDAQKKKTTRKSLLALMLTVIVLLSVGYVWLHQKENKNEPAVVAEVPFLKHPDTTYIAINLLQVLQDNPQIEFKIEDILRSTINHKAQPFQLPIKIIRTDFKNVNQTNQESIAKYANGLGYDFVYFGNLFENSLGDSAILEITGGYTYKLYERNSKIKFKTLLDSSFIKEINDQANMSIFRCVEANISKRPYPESVKILEPLKTYSSENYLALTSFLGSLKIMSDDFNGGLKKFNELLALTPNDHNRNYFITCKARAFAGLRQFDSAEIYFKKTWANDSLEVSYLISFASFYLTKRNFEKGKEMLNRVLTIDKNEATAKKWLSDIALHKFIENSPKQNLEMNYQIGSDFHKKGQYKQALEFLSRTYMVDPTYKTINALMANCYFNLGNIPTAMKQGYIALVQDSSNQTNTFLYASLLAQVTPEDKISVMHYYDLSMKINPRNLALHQSYADYLRKTEELKKCIEICELSNKMYPNDLKITRLLAGSYMALRDYRNAKIHYEFLNMMTPGQEDITAILAECILRTNQTLNKEFLRGATLAKLAVDLNPKNAIAQLVYARFLYRSNYKKLAAEHYLEAKRLDKQILDTGLEPLLKNLN